VGQLLVVFNFGDQTLRCAALVTVVVQDLVLGHLELG